MKKTAYLDHNATTTIRPEALDLLLHVHQETGNASSIHGYGRTARHYIEEARGQIARTLDVSPNQIIFNSGATEGNNTILKGFDGQRILVSAIEHPSILDSGVVTESIPVTPSGQVDVAAFTTQIEAGPPPALVSVMLVNNETGVIQPVAEIAEIAKRYGAIFHCDAVQGFGRLPFTRAELGADFITLSSHKIGGPQGVGAVVMAPKAPLPKLLMGGGQERRHRAGTENVAGIAAFGLASSLAQTCLGDFSRLTALRDQVENAIASNRVHIYGQAAPRVANTSMFSVNGLASETLLMALDLEGVAISTGSACSSGTVHFSHVLKAMGASEDDLKGALRVSLGWNTTQKDIDEFLTAWNKIRAHLIKG